MDQEDVDALTDDEADKNYYSGILSLVAVCLVVPGFSLLICPFFTAARCCQCACCERTQPKNLETRSTLKWYWVPVIFIIMCCIVIVVFSGMAYTKNTEFSDLLLYRGHGDPDSLNETIKVAASDSNLWDIVIVVMSDGSIVMANVEDNVLALKPKISTAIAEVQIILNGTSVLHSGTGVLLDMLSDIENYYSDKQIQVQYTSPWSGYVRRLEFDCEFCKTVGTECNKSRTEIKSQTDPILSELNDTVITVNENLLSQDKSIQKQISKFAKTIDDTAQQLTDMEDEFHSKRDEAETYNNNREMFYNALFAVPMVPIVFIVIGALFKLSPMFTIAYILLWMIAATMSGLLSVHLPVAVLVGDICEYLDVIDDNVTKYYDNEMGETFQACLDNSLLAEVLGLDKDLDFTDKITFPTIDNVSESFTFSGLNTFSNDSQNTDQSTFQAAGNEALTTINTNLIPNCIVASLGSYAPCSTNSNDHYTRENISLCNPGLYYDITDTVAGGEEGYYGLSNATDVLGAEAASVSKFNAIIVSLRANLSAVQEQGRVIENATQDLTDDVNNASVVLIPVFKQVDRIVDSARCGFIGDGYRNIHYLLCEDLAGVLAAIVVGMIVIGVISLTACLVSFKLVRISYWFKNRTKLLAKQKKNYANKPVNAGFVY